MFDYEGSRGEFLKILAEMGEEPAFIARARAPEVALDSLLKRCESRRAELLLWPRRHFSTLRQRVGDDWTRLTSLVIDQDSLAIFAVLTAELPKLDEGRSSWLARDRKLLSLFLDSAFRFNTAWIQFLDDSGLDEVNRLRDDYNRYYMMEKACAFGSAMTAGEFTPLESLSRDFLFSRFPLLALPTLA